MQFELRKLHEKIDKILFNQEKQMTTQAQFDAALTALIAAEAARDAAVTQAINDLLAKIAAGGVPTPTDFSTELAQIAQLQTNAAALTQTATTDDPGSTNVTSTPAA